MITSISKELFKTELPYYNGEIKMLPFNMESLNEIPTMFKELVGKMIDALPFKKGIAFLTVDGKTIERNNSHRRGGPHVDGNYILESCKWDTGGNGGGNGWKVGEGGRKLSTEHHKLSYETNTGGMLIVSDVSACKGWNGVYDGLPGIGGDCFYIELGKGFMLKPNTVYYGNSQFIHESMPVNKTTHRNLVRITLPMDYPQL